MRPSWHIFCSLTFHWLPARFIGSGIRRSIAVHTNHEGSVNGDARLRTEMTVRSFPTEWFPEPKTLEKKISKGFRAQKEERFEYPLSPVVINTERGERGGVLVFVDPARERNRKHSEERFHSLTAMKGDNDMEFMAAEVTVEKKSRFRRICVFCGSQCGKKTSYQEAAIELGKELVNIASRKLFPLPKQDVLSASFCLSCSLFLQF